MSTDWIVDGVPIAEYTYGRGANVTTVDRLTATQIVLANGHRYNRSTLQQTGKATRNAWSTLTELLPVDDWRVQDAVARDELAKVGYAVDGARRQIGSRSGVADVLAALDTIDRAVAQARAAIRGGGAS